MLKVQLVLGIITFALWVFCLVQLISTPGDRVRHLPKVAWVLLVLFFPLIGSIAWLVAGRPQKSASRRSAYEREQPQFPEYDRPGRAAAGDPAKDEEFLRRVRERAEEQRKRYEAERKKEEEGESS